MKTTKLETDGKFVKDCYWNKEKAIWYVILIQKNNDRIVIKDNLTKQEAINFIENKEQNENN